MAECRFPLSALVAASGLSEAALARKVALSGTTLKRARSDGLVWSAADRYAVRAGFLPWDVWPEWLDDPLRPCAAPGCTDRFLPHPRAPHSRYCSPRCRRRAKARRYRATPHGGEANRRHRRAYYAANRGYELSLKRIERERAADRRAAA